VHLAIQRGGNLDQCSQFQVARASALDPSDHRLADPYDSCELPLRKAPRFTKRHEILLETQSREFALDA
jgi:hypothetical protein